MIVPMKKVSLIVLSGQKEDALKKLRRLGLVHIEIAEGSGERISLLREQIASLERCAASLGKPEKGGAQAEALTPGRALAIAGEVAALSQERQECSSRQAALRAELARLAPWGEVDPAALRACAGQGVVLVPYEIPAAEYAALGECVRTLCLERTRRSVKCLAVRTGGEGEEEALARLEPCRLVLPEDSTAGLRRQCAELDGRIGAIDKKLAAHSGEGRAILAAARALEKELEFETYATGMTDEALAEGGAQDVSVSYFQGYIPAEDLGRLQQAARQNAWGLLAQDPTTEDDVPTKLKNNRFVSLIYPVTDFLGTVPGYFEFDISGWFLLFLLVFFGIIFGDGGYGLLICAIAAVPTIRALASKKAVPPAIVLVWLFGLSTVVWGTITCSWFGMPAEQVPQWLVNLSVPVFSNAYSGQLWYPFGPGGAGLTTSQNLQIFCFTLALVQLTIAHVKCAVRDRHSLKLLGDIGLALELFGIYYVVLSLVVSSAVFPLGLVLGGFPVGTAAIVLVAVGFVLNFVFSNYEGSIAGSVKASLINIVSVLLGVVNVFSDIVSYIRLWAVGLAGAAISATVNELAGPLLGNFMFVALAIVLLVFGHGLNLILNVLSVIVHGVRLNTLEFSSHLDMSWSGHKFQPFSE